MIPHVLVSLPDNRDFFFHPAVQPNLTLLTHIIDHQTSRVLIRNAFDQPLHIPRRHKLSHLIDITYDNCFFTDKQAAIDSATFPPLS